MHFLLRNGHSVELVTLFENGKVDVLCHLIARYSVALLTLHLCFVEEQENLTVLASIQDLEHFASIA